MRFSQFLLLVIVAFVACSSAVATAESAVQIQELPNREVVREDRRFLKGSKTNLDVDAAGEERIGATTPSFMQYIRGIQLPKFSKLPGIKQLKALFKGLSDKRAAWLRAKMQNNPNTHGF
ncbi:hypothetical protein DVH05_014884 [Phytophthora capsici]|nr:hypothetical protein DVH05_014884 [Phytophthora capsici]|eukprot:jgi/Phyca11/16662/fgenesh1_pg.PHYCAscaffold_21_\